MQIGHTKAGPIAGHRVAVTGLGAVSVCGIGPDALWQGLLAPPPSGLRRVPDFDPTSWLDARHARHYDRFAQFAIAAADQAIADAGDLSAHAPLDPARAGVIFGAGEGGFLTIEAQVTNYVRGGARKVSPRMIPMMMANAGTSAIAMRQGFQGPAETIVTACAAGTHSIAVAARLIATGLCDVAVGGGAEAGITEVSLAAFSNMTALSTSGISRPFDAARDGFVMGEGAGALILEEWDHALARGALIYAELLGAGASSDAHHITAPHPDGHGAALAMIAALKDAAITPDQVGYINAHGTSTPHNDLAEARAIAQVFGHPYPPVTSNKGVIGHALGASGALEAVASVASLVHAQIPPTAGLVTLDRQIDLDVVTSLRPFEPGPILSNSFGFGGLNGCLVIGPTQ